MNPDFVELLKKECSDLESFVKLLIGGEVMAPLGEDGPLARVWVRKSGQVFDSKNNLEQVVEE